MKQPTRRMSIEMTPAVLPTITAPVSIEKTPGGAIAGVPVVSRVWNTIALEFTKVICNKKMTVLFITA